MQPKELLTLLKRLADEEIELREQIAMTTGDGNPLLDGDGNRVINDVLRVGEGWLYIEREHNEPESEQDIITLLANLGEALPVMIDALETTYG